MIMRKMFLVFALVLSLFLVISTLSAEEIIPDEQTTQTGLFSVDQSVSGSDAAGNNKNGLVSDSLNDSNTSNGNFNNNSQSSGTSDAVTAIEDNATNGMVNSTAIDSSKVPYKFSSGKDMVSTYGKKVKFSVKVINKQGKAINHTLVKFKVSTRTYNVYTDAKGISSIYLNLNVGKYYITYYANNISGKNTYTVRNYYSMTYFKWNSGANVLKNKRIKANVPNNALVKKMIKLAKYGTPLIKFKGGNGKVVFITAGVHGNEIPSQVAAMKLIPYLQSHPINGTVYIMPFVNPKGTAANVRDYKGVHLNKKANKKGTISYKTVQLIKKFKCDAYGDFHATRPGGKPGKDVAMGTYNPTKKSAELAKYISKNAKVKYIIYKKAGAEYLGALEDEVNLKGIPAVTCEVISSHGKIKKGSVAKSLLMMKTLLKYNKII